MTHQEVIELLPWYVNATLSERERSEVDAHLSQCVSCTGELEQFKVIQLAVVESSEALPEPSKDLFNRAMAKVEGFERGKKSAAVASGAWFDELMEGIGDVLLGWIGPMPVLARAVVAAQFLLIIGLAAGLTYTLRSEGEIITQSGTQQGRADHSRIAIRFNESITEAQLRQLLGEIHGTIVSGPSALGIYTIEVPIPPAKTNELERLLQSLREKKQLVTFAEKMG